MHRRSYKAPQTGFCQTAKLSLHVKQVGCTCAMKGPMGVAHIYKGNLSAAIGIPRTVQCHVPSSTTLSKTVSAQQPSWPASDGVPWMFASTSWNRRPTLELYPFLVATAIADCTKVRWSSLRFPFSSIVAGA